MFRRILFLSDLSATSRLAYKPLQVLGRRPDATIFLVHAMQGTSDHGHIGAEVRAAMHADALAAATPGLLAQADELRALGVRVEPVLEHGSAFDRVLAVIDQLQADLVVIPSAGGHGLARQVSSSTTSRALTYGHVPVLTVNLAFGAAADGWHGFAPVLHPVALGEQRDAALQFVGRWASELSAPVALASVWRPLRDDPVAAAGLDAAAIATVDADTAARHDAFLRERRAALGGDAALTLLEATHVGGALCAEAERSRAGVLVMPSFQRGAAHARTLGSVTEWVIRHAPCPVLVHDLPEGAEAPRALVSLAAWFGEFEGMAEPA